jgi:hypothetical protein
VNGVQWNVRGSRTFLRDMPAEGLLGAARLAPSGPPSKTTAFNVAARRCRTRLVFLSGVRIEAYVRWNVILRFSDFRAGYAG